MQYKTVTVTLAVIQIPTIRKTELDRLPSCWPTSVFELLVKNLCSLSVLIENREERVLTKDLNGRILDVSWSTITPVRVKSAPVLNMWDLARQRERGLPVV